MELSKQRLIITGVIAGISFSLYFFLYGPLISKKRAAYLECISIENEVIQARESIVPLKTANINKELITKEDITLAMDELTRQGRLKGINFFSITPREIEKAEYFSCRILPIEMELQSTYENLGIFLGLLDNLEKNLVTVKAFNITLDKKDSPKLKTKLVVNMYLLNKNEE